VVVAVLATVVAPLLCGPGPAASAGEPRGGVECPADVVCHFVAAAYGQTVAGDPSAYGNYDRADRPRDGDNIYYIVIHDTEEPYDATMRAFRRPRSGVSAHYLINSPDGQITQLIPTRDIAFHAGNYWFNMHSIGIEHVGQLAQGAGWYTEAVYQASARLVRYLAARYHIPLDRQHILGHEDIPGSTVTSAKAMHYDPGPYWDWDRYFALLAAPFPDAGWSAQLAPELGLRQQAVAERLPGYRSWPAGPRAPRTVLISPRFATHTREVLTGCAAQTCPRLPFQPSNVVYLHSAPSADSPLLGDPLLHPHGGPGTTALADWSARASIGQSFVVAGRVPGWTGIWFGGQRGWFADPVTAPVSVTVAPGGSLLTPRPGCSAISVYGAANPERGAYPPGIAAVQTTPLPYVIPAGQVYLGAQLLPTTSYYAQFDTPTVPGNHTLITGRRMMWEISFNHRRAFLDASDVQVFTPHTTTPPHHRQPPHRRQRRHPRVTPPARPDP
jgi:N-acetyl-anhydromuramyl-L-alanine amidase AmpD